MSPLRQLLRTKPVDLIADESAHTSLGRSLGLLPLVSVGATLGTGSSSLRRTRPDLPRGFRTPVVPLLGLGMCVLLVAGLAPATWPAFGVWSAAGLVVYFAYGRRRSELARSRSGPRPSAQGE